MAGEILHPSLAAVARAALMTSAEEPGEVAAGQASIERELQAVLLDRILDRDGPDGLLAAGRHLEAIAGEPIVLAILNTDSPELLLDKLARFNRFFHSHHRHRVHALEPGRADIVHRSTNDAPPTATESTFVCGLYLALLARIGCGGLACSFPESEAAGRDVYRGGRPAGVPRNGTGRWLITWSSFEPTRPLPRLDEILLRHAPPDLTDRSIALRVEHLLRSDLARSWRLGAVANELGVSTRTLQRRLRAERRPFTRILSQTRIEAAKELLGTDERSITNVGYLTGFADTAHFTRTFKATTGSTPSEWTAANRQ